MDDYTADWLDDSETSARRLAKSAGQPCANECGNTTPSADVALCAHRVAVCDDCWPNGCAPCTAKVERDQRRLDAATEGATRVLEELRQLADEFAAVKLAQADWRTLNDLDRLLHEGSDALGIMHALVGRHTRDPLDLHQLRIGADQ